MSVLYSRALLYEPMQEGFSLLTAFTEKTNYGF